ncbi:MAG: transcriptional repressor [bacterium]|nr:transcriptional repressor [bacterium]
MNKSYSEIKIREDLKMVGLSATQVRIRILAMLRTATTPLTVEQLMHLLNSVGISIGRASLFRNLDTFVRVGLAERLSSNARASQYTACHYSSDHHHHLICTKCNRVVEVDGCVSVDTLSEIEKNAKVKITGHSIIFYGLCARCQ